MGVFFSRESSARFLWLLWAREREEKSKLATQVQSKNLVLGSLRQGLQLAAHLHPHSWPGSETSPQGCSC